MGNKLFVGGLSWDTDSKGLKDAFAEYGDVTDAKVITERDTGRSRGFGFVTFQEESSAQTAMSELDGAQLDGRSIRVDEARPRRGGGGNRGGGGGGGGRNQRSW